MGVALLSRSYSPERAVGDYFVAQSRGDVSGMMANATFQQGSSPEFFYQSGIASMMDLLQNRDLRNVKLVSSRAIDSSTQSVAVSMTWAGFQHSHTYTVRKDNSEIHAFFFRAWRIVIPLVTIHITLPNQAGPVQVDAITPATSDVTNIQVVEGYHTVTMTANFLYDSTTQVVDGVDGPPSATFAPDLSSRAVNMAAASVKLALPNCDASQFRGCLDHTYSAPNDGQRYYFDLPGYGQVFYSTYRVALAGDPTSDMKLVVPPDAGRVNAAGTCAVSLTIDGTRSYNLHGPWTATLVWDGGRFVGDISTDCWASKA